MTDAIWVGCGLVLLAGLLQGTFAVPMKYARRWKHENIWFVFVLTGLVIFPWLLTSATVSSIGEVYRASSWKSLIAIAGFGFAWGIGATLTGIALRMLGIGLGFAIVLGLSASVGSVVPLVVLTPEKIFTVQGGLYAAGTVVMLVGIVVVAIAGSLREKRQPGASSFAAGLLVAISAGLLSSMLNFAFAFGGELIANAQKAGASPVWASNAATALATSGGFIANAAYCGYQMWKNGSLPLFWTKGAASHWGFGAIMGGFWYGGLAIYGVGLERMGTFGTVAGWPLLMGTVIVASNLAGLSTGEWKEAPGRAKSYLFSGSAVILIALGILARAQRG